MDRYAVFKVVIMQDTGVFICSSDNRRDVLDRVIPSVFKYWPDCPYPIYVGLNSSPDRLPNVTPVLAPRFGLAQRTCLAVAPGSSSSA